MHQVPRLANMPGPCMEELMSHVAVSKGCIFGYDIPVNIRVFPFKGCSRLPPMPCDGQILNGWT